MSAKRVSPPVGGTAIACSTAAIDGTSRQLTSLCHPFSYPPTSADLANRTSSGCSPLAGMNGWTSSSPNRRAKRHVGLGGQRLATEEEDLVVEQRLAQLGDHGVGQLGARSTPLISAPIVAAIGAASNDRHVRPANRSRSAARWPRGPTSQS